MLVKCLACDDENEVPPCAGCSERFDENIYVCTKCGARMVYGRLIMREVVEPFISEGGKRLIRRRFQDPKTREDVFVVDVDPAFAAAVAKNMLNLVIP